MHDVHSRIAAACGARRAERQARLQSLWQGYGEATRYTLVDGPVPSVVVKQVQPSGGSGLGHARKLRSYAVEAAFYTCWAPACSARVARCHLAEQDEQGWLFVLEDLDHAGFSGRVRDPRGAQLDACLRWLAQFHAEHLGRPPEGLWSTGTYWHLATRPDEWEAMASGPLQDAAAAIDARLSSARFTTVVHGDAKPANFLFGPRSVAAVDFQYTGGGIGVKDLVPMLRGEDEHTVQHGLDVYFRALRERLPEVGAAVEAEWRPLFAWAWADYARFLSGWAPGRWWSQSGERRTRAVLQLLR